MRKLLVGLISLGAVFAAYMLYTRTSDSPVIETDPASEFIEAVADSNIDDFDGNVGKIGGIGIGTTKKAEYITLNEETKEVERIWGFEELYREGDLWRAKKPYITVFEPEFTCYITADTGLMRLETAAERTTPKDGVFSGNVVIHVSPKESGELKESFVKLDDVILLSERSKLYTKGPVEYVSDDVHMRGKGLELIYNDHSDRLEFFRIVDLEMLLIKNCWQSGMFSSGQPEADESAAVAGPTDTARQDKTVAAADSDKTEGSPTEAATAAETEDGVYYKCVLSKNVLIDTPDELIFAGQRIYISDIFWEKDSIGAGRADANDTETVAAAGQDDPAGDSNSIAPDTSADPNAAEFAAAEPNTSPDEPANVRPLDEFMQVSVDSESERPAQFETNTKRTKFVAPRIDYNVVTGDVVADGESRLTLNSGRKAGDDANEPPTPTKIAARDGVKFFKAANQVVFSGDCTGSMLQKDLTEPREVTFRSPEITVNLSEDKSERPDIFAAGPAELTFYVQDANAVDSTGDPNTAKAPESPIPVTVTAQKQARFSGAANQIVFENDCNCVTVREDANGVTEYMLLSELITVDLAEDSNDRASGLTGGIEHLKASGGVVRLATTRTAKADPDSAGYVSDANDGEVLGGVELKCTRVDYDPIRGLFEASGPPAEIWMDNSKVAVSEKDPNGFSLSEPCYALLENFDSLKYYSQTALCGFTMSQSSTASTILIP